MELFSKAEACGCNKWNCPLCKLPRGPRDGVTFEPQKDEVRLNAQAQRVFDAMRGAGWLSLAEISLKTGDPEASVSARLRDLRKARFGGFTVERRRRDTAWEYLLM